MKRWVIAMLLLCSFDCTAAFAYGYGKNAQSDSWGYQPINSATSLPTQFRTTSSYLSPLGEYRSSNPMLRNGSYPWGDEDDYGEDYEPGGNSVGEVDDNFTPVGDAPWFFMLLLAIGYIVYKKCSRRALFCVKTCICQKKVVPLQRI